MSPHFKDLDNQNPHEEDITKKYRILDKLPDELYNVIIKDLLDNEEVFVVPWAIWVKEDGSMFLNTTFDFSYESKGTSNLKIVKINGEFFVIYETFGNSKYISSSTPPQNGASLEDYAPIKILREV